jgi:hypothetical protein
LVLFACKIALLFEYNLVSDAKNYVQWANSDGRIAAIIPWHWDGCEGVPTCMKHLDEIGTAEVPAIANNWKQLVAASRVLRNTTTM